MRRILALVLALTLMLGLCAFAQADDVVELEFMYHKSETAAINGMQAVIDSFNAANPGIHITMTNVPDAAVVILTRLDDMPDMLSCVTSTQYETMFAEGRLMDISGQPFLANVGEETLKLSQFEGKTYRMPYSLSCYGLYVRTDIFEDNNIAYPTTWDELMKVCEQLKALDITPFTLPNKKHVYQRMERMMSFIAADDEEFRKIAKGEMDVKDSVTLKTYAEAEVQLAQNMTEESAGCDYDDSYKQFIAGDAAMTINGQWSLTTIKDFTKDMEPALKFALIPLPNPTGAESKVVISIDTSFCIAAATEHPAECLKFLEYLSQTEVAQAYTDIEGSPNVIKGVVLQTPELAKINEAMANGQVCISQNAIWPSGYRKALGEAASTLTFDYDIDAFLEEAELTIDEYYND